MRNGGSFASTTFRIAGPVASGSPGTLLPRNAAIHGGGRRRRPAFAVARFAEGPPPFGGEPARLDDGHLDAEARNLGSQGLAKPLEAPLRGMVETDGRKGVDPRRSMKPG